MARKTPDRHRPDLPTGTVIVNSGASPAFLTRKGQLGGFRSGVTKRMRKTTLVESGRVHDGWCYRVREQGSRIACGGCVVKHALTVTEWVTGEDTLRSTCGWCGKCWND